MRVVIQRVSDAKLDIENTSYASIGQGLLVLLGVGEEDTLEDADYICKKTLSLRIFSDSDGKMNLSIQDIMGQLLLVSQFTLFADTKKGNRPSYIAAARPDKAIPIYEYCVSQLMKVLGDRLKTGVFGADMKINLTNDGPVTIIIDSKDIK
ncbi:MAG: D-tyrosyl-tRNA(Tyr) deacylase [Cytophagales bacterium]|nr:MAG: D-tyrosyl-tRNA(Tyr) deacylase [Cytophagales bacterium]